MDEPLSGWGPNLPSLLRFRATKYIYVHFETGLLHAATSSMSTTEHQFAPRVLNPLLLFVMELIIGDRMFYTMSTGLQVPAKVVGLLHNGRVELEYDQGGVRVVNHRCPMDSISFGIPSLESPPPSPSIPAIDVPPEVPLDPLVDGSPVRGCSRTRLSTPSPSRGFIG